MNGNESVKLSANDPGKCAAVPRRTNSISDEFFFFLVIDTFTWRLFQKNCTFRVNKRNLITRNVVLSRILDFNLGIEAIMKLDSFILTRFVAKVASVKFLMD